MTTIYVIDTETSTTSWKDGIPDGHIVEIGIAKVNLDKQTVIPFFQSVINDPEADPDAWVFKHTDLSFEEVQKGVSPDIIARYLSSQLEGQEVTSFNEAFDHGMIDRDMPFINDKVRWGQCLMIQAAEIEEIPRNHAGTGLYPTAEATYNYLCPKDPCHLNGKEKHRALADATMEGYILVELYLNDLYHPLERTRHDRMHRMSSGNRRGPAFHQIGNGSGNAHRMHQE